MAKSQVTAATALPASRRRLSPATRRRDMLKIGLSLFGARAYEDVSVDEICSAAGVSRPLLQHYFGSKTAFFVAVVAEAVEELERLTTPIKGQRNFALLDQHLHAFFGFMRSHPAGATMVRRQGQTNREIAAVLDRYRDRTFTLVAQTLGRHISREVATAIRSWIAHNEAIAAQLIAEPELDVAWAARFSQANLMTMVAAAV
jgi:AcrR family transcriptional regulator